jgi:PAS domain S-box-containing protein
MLRQAFQGNSFMEQFNSQFLLEALPNAVYATDMERRIIYWNREAERITGWRAEDVIGHCCQEHLQHHRSLGECYACTSDCPLKRAMSHQLPELPIMLYASTRDGRRVPLQITTAPLHGADGQLIGAIQTFQEMPDTLERLELELQHHRAQQQARLIDDPRLMLELLQFQGVGLGRNIFCSHREGDRVALLLAQITGDGIPAALYGLRLRAIWPACTPLQGSLAACMNALGARLHDVGCDDSALALALLVRLDLAALRLELVSAGWPTPWLVTPKQIAPLPCPPNDPLGLGKKTEFREHSVDLQAGERLLAVSESVLNLDNAEFQQLGEIGLLNLLQGMHYPALPLRSSTVRAELMRFSARIDLPQDLTFMEIGWR